MAKNDDLHRDLAKQRDIEPAVALDAWNIGFEAGVRAAEMDARSHAGVDFLASSSTCVKWRWFARRGWTLEGGW